MKIENKKIGSIIKLDPTKNYIMLVNRESGLTPDMLEKISLENGAIILGENLESNITFVENSESITDIVYRTK